MEYHVQYDKKAVDRAVRLLAFSINTEMVDHEEEDVIVLTLLEGGAYLTSRIMKVLPEEHLKRIINKSMKVSSYHNQERGNLSIDYVPDADFKNHHVIVLDDFCDSGSTINEIYEYLTSIGAKSISFYTLLARERFQIHKNIRFRCGILDHTSRFYIGCGLDDDGKSRFLDEIVYKE